MFYFGGVRCSELRGRVQSCRLGAPAPSTSAIWTANATLSWLAARTSPPPGRRPLLICYCQHVDIILQRRDLDHHKQAASQVGWWRWLLGLVWSQQRGACTGTGPGAHQLVRPDGGWWCVQGDAQVQIAQPRRLYHSCLAALMMKGPGFARRASQTGWSS